MAQTVLIADDHAGVRESYRRLLQTLPEVAVVAEACDGDEAVTLALQHRPDVVLMDVSMPRLDGFEATRRIRQNTTDVCVIIVTADAQESHAARAAEVGADGFVAKMTAAGELPRALAAVGRGERFTTPLVGRHRDRFPKRVVFSNRHAEDMDASPSRALTGAEYQLLVRHSPVMIWRSGLDAGCDYFNETWLAFTGRTLEQELGEGWAAGVHPDDLERCVARYLEHFRRRESFETEYRLRRHDGEYRWIVDRGVPVTDDAGAFAGFIGSCIDIDDRRQAQAAQQQHDREQLELARDFEKWILAIVSHDIRDPLGAILFAARRLHDAAEPGAMAKKHGEIVERGVRRIQHIIGDLLDLSPEREGAGIHIAPKRTDLRSVCRQIVDELEIIARDREITFDCDVDGSGDWDEHRIVQAISNLASNAVRHGTPGFPVHVRLTGDEQRVAVEVHNRGTIPSELLPRIFEPFRSGRHDASRGDGLGLGLFIARAIARAHGGGVEVDSSGDATTFRLFLPRYAA